MKTKLFAATAAGGALLLSTFALGGTAAASGGQDHRHHNTHDNVVHGQLNELNDSGASGKARVKVAGKKLQVSYTAKNLAPDLPHAAHIHYGEQATHECPTVRDDLNRDGRINVVEGVPRYGPIAVSLTTSGDTSPKSALDVARFSSAPEGRIDYQRQIKTSKDVARAIRNGEGVLVVHGVDYNDNGKYDFAGAGESELNAALPAEATDPALCGVLR
jgi:hypothetical protein